MTALVVPSTAGYEAWAECVRDFADPTQMSGSGAWWVEGFGPDRDSFERLLRRVEELADTSTPPPDGLVPSDCFWIVDEDVVIGFLMLRHSIDNDFLRTQGGHIGYSVRPSYRRRGYASQALGLALDTARRLGLDRVLITCDTDNVASARTIESQGGVFESTFADKRRYWITL